MEIKLGLLTEYSDILHREVFEKKRNFDTDMLVKNVKVAVTKGSKI